jgi:hypothetical protein
MMAAKLRMPVLLPMAAAFLLAHGLPLRIVRAGLRLQMTHGAHAFGADFVDFTDRSERVHFTAGWPDLGDSIR